MITVYGIKTCNTVRNALKWLADEDIAHTFHDFRADGLEAATVARWVNAQGWESVLNKRSATWAQLSDADRQDLNDERAIKLMVAHPTLIKRPVFESKSLFEQGFTEDVRHKLA